MGAKIDNKPLTADNPADDDLDSLSAAEKTAFEKIMAEINSSASPSGIASPSATSDSPQIQNGDEAPTAMESDSVGAQNDDEGEPSLTDEQQEALDRIMAEINGTAVAADENDTTPIQTSGEGPVTSQPRSEIPAEPAALSAEQPVLQSDAESLPEEKDTPQPEPLPTPTLPADISLEEFNDELEKLLGGSTTTAPSKTAPHTPTSPNQDPPTNSAPEIHAPAQTSLRIEPIEPTPSDVPTNEPPAEATASPHGDQLNAEVVASGPKAPLRPPPARTSVRKSAGSKFKPTYVITLLLLTVIAVGAYFGYFRWLTPSGEIARQDVLLPALEPVKRNAPISAPEQPIPQNTIPSAPAGVPVPEPVPPLDQLMTQIVGTRDHVLKKTAEIQGLKRYYETGIADDMAVVEEQIPPGILPEFSAAMTQKPLELTLRSIQRRKTYQTKLDQPLQQLSEMTEELLYHERAIGLYQLLQKNMVRLPMTDLQQRVDASIHTYQRYIDRLSIDDIQVVAPSLESIWQSISADLKARRERSAQLNPQNSGIGEQICRGDMTRLSLLSRLTEDTARCLARWTGKDMYLIGLTELPPEVARILSQWPGESLSLNGLTSLSAEAARHLAQWQGKRLALNGITVLSAEATRHLSHWKGSQLEMIGLQSIGPWENYITRLYLSEKLRKQLEQ